MSYSICLRCDETVSYYQKYCSECEKKYRQDEFFWRDKGLKTEYGTKERELEIMENLQNDSKDLNK